ncbi:MAG TPA: class I SAM-dependent methyltransferase [Thermoanaerobaculia bacterium]
MARSRYRMVAPYVAGDVLDIGCGRADLLRDHAGAIRRYVGVEFHADRVESLSRRYPRADFRIRNLDEEALEIEGTFDVILLVAVIEHIWNQRFLLSQLAPRLKPGGFIVFTTPTPFGNDVVHRLGAALSLFARSAVDDHIVIYNKLRFRHLAREFGFELVRYRRFQFFSNQLAVFQRA